jgi:hypothetical protein
VTAYGGGAARCKVETWDSDGMILTVKVLCFTVAGAPVDSQYTVLYQADELPGGNDAGYARVTAAGVAPTQFQVNSSGPAVLNTVTHAPGSGLYRIDLPGLGAPGGNIQVTAFGPGSVHCKARSLSHDDAPVRTVAVVGCHNSLGTLVDSAFSIAYTNNEVPNRRHGAYAQANADGSGAPPPGSFSTTGPVAYARLADGVYDVNLSAMPAFNDTNVVVTAFGSGATTCKVGGWFAAAGPSTTVRVLCFGSTGAPANHPFSLHYITNLPI